MENVELSAPAAMERCLSLVRSPQHGSNRKKNK